MKVTNYGDMSKIQEPSGLMTGLPSQEMNIDECLIKLINQLGELVCSVDRLESVIAIPNKTGEQYYDPQNQPETVRDCIVVASATSRGINDKIGWLCDLLAKELGGMKLIK